MDSGAASIIQSIRGAEQALAKDLKGEPRVLLSEERLLHQASQLALQAGMMHRTQAHVTKKLHSIEASLVQSTKQQARSQFLSIARQEAQLLRGGQRVLKEVAVVNSHLAQALGHQGDPSMTAKMHHLMDRVEKEVLLSGSEAASGAKKVAAEVRKDARAAGVGVFAQAQSKESSGIKNPVRRLHFSKEALSNIVAAKSEVEAAYGTSDGNAQAVEALLGKLSGSLRVLEKGDKEDVQEAKTDKADEMQRIAEAAARSGELTKLRAKEEEDEAMAAKAEALAKLQVVRAAEAHAAQADAVTDAVEKAKTALKSKAAVMAFTQDNFKSARKNLMARRYRRQRLHMRKLVQRTQRLD